MPLYQYQAFDLKGKKVRGAIEGEGIRDAKEKLRRQGIMVSRIEAGKSVASKENLKGEALLSFTLELSQLVDAGVPLYESLVALEEQYRGEPSHRILLSLCEQIKGGNSLSQAMAAFPDSFDTLYLSMVRAGESSGALGLVFKRLVQFLQRRMKVRKQLMTAMIYPSILAGFSLLIIFLLLGFVLPSIEGVFEGRELNRFTAAVLGVSHFLQSWWWLYLPLLAGAGVLLYFKMRTKKAREWMQALSLKLPFVKKLVVQASLARFTRTMGTLQAGGLTMIDSLRIARGVLGNVVMEREFKAVEEKIVSGSLLSRELEKSAWIPKMASRMVAVGEDTGDLMPLFNKIADIYEEELEKTVDRLMALMQPVILVVMGAVIGIILLAVLLPLTDIGILT